MTEPADAGTLRLGARVLDPVRVEFRVWAPRAGRVAVAVDGQRHELATDDGDTFSAVVDAEAGARYAYLVDGAPPLADPCSAAQPDGVRGPSQVVDHATFAWIDEAWDGVALDELVVYELHIGTFTKEGTFAAARRELAALRELGVTAVELMPIATFPGDRGWGYDGLYTWAPHHSYGGPAGLAAFVDAAHREGLGVLLDVVYNHVGPGAEALGEFGPYFTDRHTTFWGDALDYSQRGVREWAIQNAEHWVRDYHVDGLRLDATHAVFDDRRPHVLAELAARVRAIRPSALVISEIETGDERPIREWGHDAQWADELHHALHVMLTGETDGYYAAYGSLAQVGHELERDAANRLVVGLQNHDQVGNRAFGDRLRGRRLRLGAFCTILSPAIPLLFMGEEYDEAHPFQFFTDHIDPLIADATRTGRRREFARFAAFAGHDLPDPQAPATFAHSKLDRATGDPMHRRYYRMLLQLRQRLRAFPVCGVAIDEERRVLIVRRDPVELVMNFSTEPFAEVPPMTGVVRGLEHLAG